MFKKVTISMVLIVAFCASYGQEAGVVANINFEGQKRSKISYLKSICEVKVRSVLDSVALDRDIIRLERLPAVGDAYYQVKKIFGNEYDVIYTIQENHTLIPQLNVYTTDDDDEFAFRVGLYEFNTFGRNITFGGFYQNDIYNSFGVNFRAPQLINKKLGLAVNFQDLTTEEPVFLSEGASSYKYNNTSFEVLGLYTFNLKHRIETGVTFFNEDYQYKSGSTSPDVPQSFDVDKLLLKGIYEYNDLEYYFHFISGFKSTFNFQYVKSTNATLPDFVIGWNDFQYFKRIRKKGNWASRLRLGLASNIDSPFAPFSVDNNLNVRGVGNTIDRGTGVIVLNTEYRHTIYDKKWFLLQSNTFVDAGTWRNPGGDFGDFSDIKNIRVFPGIGLRFIHKKIFNAVFRIDYGIGVIKDATTREDAGSGFVFGIGQYF